MYQLLPTCILLAGLAFPLSCQSSPNDPTVGSRHLVTTVYQSKADWIENQHVLPNGHLLLSTLSSGDVFILDPGSKRPAPIKLLNLPGSAQVLGLTALSHGLYAAIGGSQDGWQILNPKLYLFKLDGTLVDSIPGPESGSFLNGLDRLPNKPHIALSSDSTGGKIYRFDTKTGEVAVAASGPAFKGASDPDVALPLGVNGLKVKGNYLYFTNTYQGTFGKFQIDPHGNKVGSVEILARLPLPTGFGNHFDDLALDNEGNAYVAQSYQSVIRVTPRGVVSLVPGTGKKDSKTRNPTSVGLAQDGKSIYVTTGTTNFTGTFYAGGVFKIDI